jgi:hypothetical protein
VSSVPSTSWDLWVDFHRTDGEGLTHTRLDDLERPLDLRHGTFLVVGNEEADPAVAEVVTVEPDGLVLVRVLPGAVTDHLELVEHRRPTTS